METDNIRTHSPTVIDESTRELYFRTGYLSLPDLVDAKWLETLRNVTHRLIADASTLTASNEAFDLGPHHSNERPDVRRIRAAVDRDPAYWLFAADSVITDLAADLLGPHVKFHSAKLNMKGANGGAPVKWHQDIQAWPHTNYSPLTIGVYLDDVSAEQGPLQAIPGSHDGPLYNQYDGERWTGFIHDNDLPSIGLDQAVSMPGAAGTAVVVNCRTIHGSEPNHSNAARPLLLYVYSAADAFAYTPAPTPTSHTGEIVRGRAAPWAHHDPRPCPIPPDWSKMGYGSIFTAQQGE
ncbi:MAG: phytanoyl-CoA dioxygenase family protein [Chromatiales bacterium]|jgi:ectoine hydroxylase|nr:phytanoyl-CoA dioxygenase family protein [Chromatiales bacterium]